MKIPTADILNCAATLNVDMLSFLKRMVAIESPTSDALATRQLLYEIQSALRALDYYVSVIPAQKMGGSLYARPTGRVRGRSNQLLVGHGDTVWPKHTLDTMPLVQTKSVVKGPGVFDMKAGITQIVFAIRILTTLKLETPLTPLIFINSDEETGSRESTLLIKRLSKISSRAYILEPPMGPEGHLKTARKGLGRFTLSVKGEPAHAGLDPGAGASAILELSHQIQRLFGMNDLEKGITVNVGMIDGGTRANVIAPMASAVIDVRVLNHKDGQKIKSDILSLKPINPMTELHIEGDFGRPPMEKTERNRRLWTDAKNMAGQMGLALQETTAGGGSDGNTTSQYTATLDGLGTPGDGAHAIHEHIHLDKLAERTALLTHLLMMP